MAKLHTALCADCAVASGSMSPGGVLLFPERETLQLLLMQFRTETRYALFLEARQTSDRVCALGHFVGLASFISRDWQSGQSSKLSLSCAAPSIDVISMRTVRHLSFFFGANTSPQPEHSQVDLATSAPFSESGQ